MSGWVGENPVSVVTECEEDDFKNEEHNVNQKEKCPRAASKAIGFRLRAVLISEEKESQKHAENENADIGQSSEHNHQGSVAWVGLNVIGHRHIG